MPAPPNCRGPRAAPRLCPGGPALRARARNAAPGAGAPLSQNGGILREQFPRRPRPFSPPLQVLPGLRGSSRLACFLPLALPRAPACFLPWGGRRLASAWAPRGAAGPGLPSFFGGAGVGAPAGAAARARLRQPRPHQSGDPGPGGRAPCASPPCPPAGGCRRLPWPPPPPRRQPGAGRARARGGAALRPGRPGRAAGLAAPGPPPGWLAPAGRVPGRPPRLPCPVPGAGRPAPTGAWRRAHCRWWAPPGRVASPAPAIVPRLARRQGRCAPPAAVPPCGSPDGWLRLFRGGPPGVVRGAAGEVMAHRRVATCDGLLASGAWRRARPAGRDGGAAPCSSLRGAAPGAAWPGGVELRGGGCHG